MIREPVERVVFQNYDADRLGPEGLEALARDVRAALRVEGEDRDPDRDGAIRSSGTGDDGRGPGSRSAAKSRDDEDDVRGQRSPEGPFLFLRGHTGSDDSVLILRVREEDLHVAFRLRQTRG